MCADAFVRTVHRRLLRQVDCSIRDVSWTIRKSAQMASNMPVAARLGAGFVNLLYTK